MSERSTRASRSRRAAPSSAQPGSPAKKSRTQRGAAAVAAAPQSDDRDAVSPPGSPGVAVRGKQSQLLATPNQAHKARSRTGTPNKAAKNETASPAFVATKKRLSLGGAGAATDALTRLPAAVMDRKPMLSSPPSKASSAAEQALRSSAASPARPRGKSPKGRKQLLKGSGCGREAPDSEEGPQGVALLEQDRLKLGLPDSPRKREKMPAAASIRPIPEPIPLPERFETLQLLFTALDRAMCIARKTQTFRDLQKTVAVQSKRTLSMVALRQIVAVMPELYTMQTRHVDGERQLVLFLNVDAPADRPKRAAALKEHAELLHRRLELFVKAHIAASIDAAIDPASVKRAPPGYDPEEVPDIEPVPDPLITAAAADGPTGVDALLAATPSKPNDVASGPASPKKTKNPDMRGVNRSLIQRIRDKEKQSAANAGAATPHAGKINLMQHLLNGVIYKVNGQKKLAGVAFSMELNKFCRKLASEMKGLGPKVPEDLLRLLSEEVATHCQAGQAETPWCSIVTVPGKNTSLDYFKIQPTFDKKAVDELIERRMKELKQPLIS